MQTLFTYLVIGWPLVAIAGLALRTMITNAGLSDAEWTGWVFLAWTPVAIALVMARGRATASVAQILYDTERHENDERRYPESIG